MSFGEKIKGLFKSKKSPQNEQTQTKNMGENKDADSIRKSKIKSAGSSDVTSKIEVDAPKSNSHIQEIQGEGQSEDDITKALDLDDLENLK